MTRPVGTLILGLALLAGPGCGRKGPLELPPGREPAPAERVTAALENGAAVLTWANPVKAVSGKPLGPLETIEIWVLEGAGPAAGATPAPGEVEAEARLALRIATDGREATMSRSVPVPEGAKRLAFTVRVRDRRGRVSAFSPWAVVDVARAPGGPAPAEREGP